MLCFYSKKFKKNVATTQGHFHVLVIGDCIPMETTQHVIGSGIIVGCGTKYDLINFTVCLAVGMLL
jgi:hypothetical protein